MQKLSISFSEIRRLESVLTSSFALAIALAMAGPVTADTTIIGNGFDGLWETPFLSIGIGGFQNHGSLGGNPDWWINFLIKTDDDEPFVLSPRANAIHLVYTGQSFDPATMGTIQSVSATVDGRKISGPATPLVGLAVRQKVPGLTGGCRYHSSEDSSLGDSWSSMNLGSNTAIGFALDYESPALPGNPSDCPPNPDFSPNGAPLEFGVSTSLVGPGDEHTRFGFDNFEATITFEALSPAELGATKQVVETDDGLIYTIVLTNIGPKIQLDNPGAELEDVLPSSLALVSASIVGPGPGTLTTDLPGNSVSWNGPLALHQSVTIEVTADFSPHDFLGEVLNQATVSYDSDGNGSNETNVGSDDPSVGGTNDPTVLFRISPATLTATKEVERQDDSIIYSLVLTNEGPDVQYDNPGPELEDILPSSLALVSAVVLSGGGSITTDLPANTVWWNGEIEALDTVAIEILATLSPDNIAAVIANQASAISDSDGDGVNDTRMESDDPTTEAINDPTILRRPVTEIPTASHFGLALLALCLGLLGAISLRR